MKDLFEALRRKIVGVTPLDQDFPDSRPSNPVRDRHEIAAIMAKVNTKEDALGLLRDSQAAGWTEYDYRKPLHARLVQEASARAKELGADADEITRMLEAGNLSGATMRSGFE